MSEVALDLRITHGALMGEEGELAYQLPRLRYRCPHKDSRRLGQPRHLLRHRRFMGWRPTRAQPACLVQRCSLLQALQEVLASSFCLQVPPIQRIYVQVVYRVLVARAASLVQLPQDLQKLTLVQRKQLNAVLYLWIIVKQHLEVNYVVRKLLISLR